MSQPPGIVATVIIPAHNAEATIGAQLRALAAQQCAPEFEIIVVLNCCTDHTHQEVQCFATTLANLVIVEANERPSAAFARNRGAALGRGSALLFCDADDEVGPQWVAALLEGLGSAGLVGGQLEPVIGGPYPRWLSTLPGFIRSARPGLSHLDGRIWYPPTAAMACRRQDFVAVGGFDEQIEGATTEDVQLAVRLLNAGCRLALAPAATFRYSVRSTPRDFIRQQRAYQSANTALLQRIGKVSPPRPRRSAVRRLASLAKAQRIVDPRFYRAVAVLDRMNDGADSAVITLAPDAATQAGLHPSAPLLGGYLVDCLAAEAHRLSAKGALDETLQTVERLMPPGGIALALGDDVGLLALAAAVAGGPDASVLTIVSSPLRRTLLRSNANRLQVGRRIKDVDVEVSEPVEAVDLILIAGDDPVTLLSQIHLHVSANPHAAIVHQSLAGDVTVGSSLNDWDTPCSP